jgi:hypothetical protein
MVAMPCAATEPAAVEEQRVDVTAHAPAMEQKSYRDLLAAMERFERYRTAHPDAQLRFRIYQRKEGIAFSELRVWLLDPEDGTRVELALEPDAAFRVPVLPTMREHDAIVRTNMPDGMLTWMVEVRRANDDERHHLLGDLREACLLDVDFAHLGRTIKLPAFYAMDAVADNVCTVRGSNWGAFAEKPVYAVHLSAGERRSALMSDQLHGPKTSPLCPMVDGCYLLRDRLYHSPLIDASWPDDTAVDVVYVTDPDPQAIASGTDPTPAKP